MSRLEHVNITVSDPAETAKMLTELFGWAIRWEGAATNGGYTIHIGSADSYVALYTGPGGEKNQSAADKSYLQLAGLNHIGVVVDDVDVVEAKVIAMGLTPHSHADYEPGRRFYFHDPEGVEIEVVQYD